MMKAMLILLLIMLPLEMWMVVIVKITIENDIMNATQNENVESVFMKTKKLPFSWSLNSMKMSKGNGELWEVKVLVQKKKIFANVRD